MSLIHFDVRRCEDGILAYNLRTRTTHLIPTAVWEFFMAMSQGQASAEKEHEDMIKVLRQVGLIDDARC